MMATAWLDWKKTPGGKLPRTTITFRQARGYLPGRRASLPFVLYS